MIEDEKKAVNIYSELNGELEISLTKWLFELLLDFAEEMEINKMTPNNLGIVFGPGMVGSSGGFDTTNRMSALAALAGVDNSRLGTELIEKNIQYLLDHPEHRPLRPKKPLVSTIVQSSYQQLQNNALPTAAPVAIMSPFGNDKFSALLAKRRQLAEDNEANTNNRHSSIDEKLQNKPTQHQPAAPAIVLPQFKLRPVGERPVSEAARSPNNPPPPQPIIPNVSMLRKTGNMQSSPQLQRNVLEEKASTPVNNSTTHSTTQLPSAGMPVQPPRPPRRMANTMINMAPVQPNNPKSEAPTVPPKRPLPQAAIPKRENEEPEPLSKSLIKSDFDIPAATQTQNNKELDIPDRSYRNSCIVPGQQARRAMPVPKGVAARPKMPIPQPMNNKPSLPTVPKPMSVEQPVSDETEAILQPLKPPSSIPTLPNRPNRPLPRVQQPPSTYQPNPLSKIRSEEEILPLAPPPSVNNPPQASIPLKSQSANVPSTNYFSENPRKSLTFEKKMGGLIDSCDSELDSINMLLEEFEPTGKEETAPAEAYEAKKLPVRETPPPVPPKKTQNNNESDFFDKIQENPVQNGKQLGKGAEEKVAAPLPSENNSIYHSGGGQYQMLEKTLSSTRVVNNTVIPAFSLSFKKPVNQEASKTSTDSYKSLPAAQAPAKPKEVSKAVPEPVKEAPNTIDNKSKLTNSNYATNLGGSKYSLNLVDEDFLDIYSPLKTKNSVSAIVATPRSRADSFFSNVFEEAGPPVVQPLEAMNKLESVCVDDNDDHFGNLLEDVIVAEPERKLEQSEDSELEGNFMQDPYEGTHVPSNLLSDEEFDEDQLNMDNYKQQNEHYEQPAIESGEQYENYEEYYDPSYLIQEEEETVTKETHTPPPLPPKPNELTFEEEVVEHVEEHVEPEVEQYEYTPEVQSTWEEEEQEAQEEPAPIQEVCVLAHAPMEPVVACQEPKQLALPPKLRRNTEHESFIIEFEKEMQAEKLIGDEDMYEEEQDPVEELLEFYEEEENPTVETKRGSSRPAVSKRPATPSKNISTPNIKAQMNADPQNDAMSQPIYSSTTNYMNSLPSSNKAAPPVPKGRRFKRKTQGPTLGAPAASSPNMTSLPPSIPEKISNAPSFPVSSASLPAPSAATSQSQSHFQLNSVDRFVIKADDNNKQEKKKSSSITKKLRLKKKPKRSAVPNQDSISSALAAPTVKWGRSADTEAFLAKLTAEGMLPQ